jgi:hypothetical protein
MGFRSSGVQHLKLNRHMLFPCSASTTEIGRHTYVLKGQLSRRISYLERTNGRPWAANWLAATGSRAWRLRNCSVAARGPFRLVDFCSGEGLQAIDKYVLSSWAASASILPFNSLLILTFHCHSFNCLVLPSIKPLFRSFRRRSLTVLSAEPPTCLSTPSRRYLCLRLSDRSV